MGDAPSVTSEGIRRAGTRRVRQRGEWKIVARDFSADYGTDESAIGTAPLLGVEAFVRSRSKTAITRLVLEELARGLPRGRRGRRNKLQRGLPLLIL